MSAALKTFVDPDLGLLELKTDIGGLALYSLFGVLGFAMLLILCGCCSTCCWLFKPRRADGNYRSCPHCCACQVWCLSFFFLFIVFFVTGIMNLLLIPTASLCVMLQDI